MDCSAVARKVDLACIDFAEERAPLRRGALQGRPVSPVGILRMAARKVPRHHRLPPCFRATVAGRDRLTRRGGYGIPLAGAGGRDRPCGVFHRGSPSFDVALLAPWSTRLPLPSKSSERDR